jgi:DNA-directed RNA polymerase subunit RPC12/RpoP
MPNDDYDDAYICGSCGDRVEDREDMQRHEHGKGKS